VTAAIHYTMTQTCRRHGIDPFVYLQDVLRRLLSPEALRPDASYIEGLWSLIDDQRTFQKDSEAIG
jgi:hypothetical protein